MPKQRLAALAQAPREMLMLRMVKVLALTLNGGGAATDEGVVAVFYLAPGRTAAARRRPALKHHWIAAVPLQHY